MSSESSVSNCGIPPIRAVNLGGWLVVEGWIKESLFEDIPNKDFLDGTQLKFKSVTTGKYLRADNGGGSNIVANKPTAGNWEIFRIWRIDENRFNLRVAKSQFVGLSKADGTRVVAAEYDREQAGIFEIVLENPGNSQDPEQERRARIKAPNGYFLQVRSEQKVTADYKGQDGWCDDNPSVFLLEVNTKLRGEYQLTNGLGPYSAPQVMQKHWDTFIVEEDFKFMKDNGLNCVRIPVGWWIADTNPPKPYVAGSLEALDDAFNWAEKYGIKVIVDLHAAPGSQSGSEPSSSPDGEEEWEPHNYTKAHEKFRAHFSVDGFHEWAQKEDNVKKTLDVIDFLTARYASRSSLFAVELLNEPGLSPSVHLDFLMDYYKRGYEVVRKYTDTAYVIMCARLGPGHDPTELISLAKELPKSVIDVHYYNLFDEEFKDLDVEENINYITNERAKELRLLNKSALIFVGEWVAELLVEGATKEDYQRFAKAQLQVYGDGTFGWAYWTLKNDNKHWDMKWMIQNGYITLPPLDNTQN